MVFLNEGQKMIYGRKRIMDTFYKTHPVGKDVLEDEIGEITFDDDHVLLNVEDNLLRIKKSEVIKNFWEHRTRTPSYFDYKIWRSRPQEGGKYIGVPIAAIDHNAQVNRILGSDIKVSTDKDGTKRIYFITPVDKACTCGSFNQMKEHEKELRHLPINSINYTEEQKIRSKNLELMRALQDVNRLTSDNVQYKLEIIELKQKIKELESPN